LTKRSHLACENFIETIIIRSRCEKSAIACKANRRMRATVLGETHYELGREMRRIGRASTIPAHEQFVSGAQTLLDQIGRLCELRVKIGKRLQSLGCGGNRFVELLDIRHGFGACLE